MWISGLGNRLLRAGTRFVSYHSLVTRLPTSFHVFDLLLPSGWPPFAALLLSRIASLHKYRSIRRIAKPHDLLERVQYIRSLATLVYQKGLASPGGIRYAVYSPNSNFTAGLGTFRNSSVNLSVALRRPAPALASVHLMGQVVDAHPHHSL